MSDSTGSGKMSYDIMGAVCAGSNPEGIFVHPTGVPGHGRQSVSRGRLAMQERQPDDVLGIMVEGRIAEMEEEDSKTVFRNGRK
jgi:hypothetical protein